MKFINYYIEKKNYINEFVFFYFEFYIVFLCVLLNKFLKKKYKGILFFFVKMDVCYSFLK